MHTPILSTKLYLPPLRAEAVPRPRLVAQLKEGLSRKLTLVSAAAGSGKSTLISEWLSACGRPAAWLSLDAGDSDLTRFLTYLAAALQTVTRQGEELLAALQAPQRPPVEAILTALLNAIAACPERFILVLDDYHAIDADPVDDAVRFLLEHLPPQMHLVIASRTDPRLPLARLRARGELLELRAVDLRFTYTEAAGFLNQAMGLELAPGDVAALEQRTEGWIAGLQMAALSMQGRPDPRGFIQAFSGSHRFVLDYLVEEVLQRQPQHVRSFLLQTAVLDRLSGPLCDAVTERKDGRGLLELLERANLFIVPLDEQRQWYRYHHLFAEVLQARLAQELPEQAAHLHQRASAWYEQNGLPSDAIRHAVCAGEVERAADLIEQIALTMLLSRQERTLIDWLKRLPDEPIRRRPVLSVYHALALVSGDLEGAEAYLGHAEAALGLKPESDGVPDQLPTGLQVIDLAGYRSLPGIIAIVRAYRAGATADVAGSLAYARRALAVLPEHDDLWRGAAATLLGLANWTSGDLEEAYRCFTVGLERLQRADEITHSIAGTFILGNIRTAQGRLGEAAQIYQQMLHQVAAQTGRMPPAAADLYVGLSQVRREQGDLNGALELLERSKETSAQGLITENRHLWYVAAARLKEAEGDPEGALALLDEAGRLYIRSPDPDVTPIAAIKARVWIRQGRLAEALRWIKERGLTADDPLSYLQEFEHITLARFLMAQERTGAPPGSLRAAIGLLERLLPAAEAGGRMGSVIELLVLQALTYDVQGDSQAALGRLTRALMLAEPEGFMRLFLDEGRPLAELLARLAARGVPPRLNLYVQALLTAFAQQISTPATGRTSDIIHHLAEPLSERERTVLRLLATELSGPEMARELMVSLNTLRTHTKNIYQKLGVTNRRAAVHRAGKLNLL